MRKSVFFQWKRTFCQKNTCFNNENEVFKQKRVVSSEIVFYSGNLSFTREKRTENPLFSSGKDRFVRKIQVLTPKTRFSSRKELISSEIVFYSGNLSFPREKLMRKSVFSSGKERFVRKNTCFNNRKRGFQVEKSSFI